MKAFILGNDSQFTYGFSVHLYCMFLGEFFSKFLVISHALILVDLWRWFSYQIAKKIITWYLRQTYFLWERVKFYGQDAGHFKTPQSTFFNNVFIAYIYMLCCLAQQLKINCKYTIINWWLETKLRQVCIWLRRPLNQCFLIVRASLIFVCVWHRPTFFSGIFTI